MSNHIYIVFSSTPYKIGKAIRFFTGEPYNHVSIALDEELKEMYSFARRYYKTPFYGGFVKESLSRYQHNGNKADICIYKLPVTEQQYNRIRIRMRHMLRNKEIYLYNHISILGTIVKRPVKIKGAYTCAEFCVLILNNLGLDVQPDKYYTLGNLQEKLKDYINYTGPIPQAESYDIDFYADKPTTHPSAKTVRDFLRLFPRIGG